MDLHALLAILGFGALMGALHVVQGPDHLAALLPLSAGRRWNAAWLGARWGVGHSSGVVAVSLLALLLKDLIADMEDPFFHGWGMSIVGVMLVVIGILGIRRALRSDLLAHAHGADGHAHSHHHETHGNVPRVTSHGSGRVAFLAGIVHGITGPAHIVGVGFAVLMPGWLSAGSYLLAFCLGTIAAMTVFALFVGLGTALAAARAPALIKGVMIATAVVAIVVGLACIILPHLGVEIDLHIFEPNPQQFGLGD